ATFGRAGGNIQVVTKSGANDFHGAAYEYFRNEALNANSPTLKAAGVKRPILQRNVFGGMLGGPIRKEKTFFFISYQGTRERNEASPRSLSSNVLIDSHLTNDRSEQTLRQKFNVPSVHPTALALLNVKLPNGKFLIPNPQATGRYAGYVPASYQEDELNKIADDRLNERNWLPAKFFFSNSPKTTALNDNGGNVPGFGDDQEQNNRLISLQDAHTISPKTINEARIGYNFIRNFVFPHVTV